MISPLTLLELRRWDFDRWPVYLQCTLWSLKALNKFLELSYRVISLHLSPGAKLAHRASLELFGLTIIVWCPSQPLGPETDSGQSGCEETNSSCDSPTTFCSANKLLIFSSFSSTIQSNVGKFAWSSVVNTEEKYEFILWAMLRSSVKTVSSAFSEVRSLVSLRLDLRQNSRKV